MKKAITYFFIVLIVVFLVYALTDNTLLTSINLVFNDTQTNETVSIGIPDYAYVSEMSINMSVIRNLGFLNDTSLLLYYTFDENTGTFGDHKLNNKQKYSLAPVQASVNTYQMSSELGYSNFSYSINSSPLNVTDSSAGFSLFHGVQNYTIFLWFAANISGGASTTLLHFTDVVTNKGVRVDYIGPGVTDSIDWWDYQENTPQFKRTVGGNFQGVLVLRKSIGSSLGANKTNRTIFALNPPTLEFNLEGVQDDLILNTTTKQLTMGAAYSNVTGLYSSNLTGRIDEFMFFNRSLSEEEINSLAFSQGNPYNLNVTANGVSLFDSPLFVNYSETFGGNLTECAGSNLCNDEITISSEYPGFLLINNINTTYEYGVEQCAGIFNYSVVNFSYFDQTSGAAITATNAYDLNVYDPFTQAVNGSFTGNTMDPLCTNINPIDVNVTYLASGDLTLSEPSYATKIVSYDALSPLTLINDPTNTEDLFLILLNSSTTVQFTWLTTAYVAIDGTMLIYECAGNGSRTLVDSISIVDGIATANIELLLTPYSYEVVYNNILYTDPSGWTACHVESQDSRQFLVDVGEDISDVLGLYSISCDLSKLDNDTVRMNWSDNPESTETLTGCIYADRVAVTGTVNVYVNCTSEENFLERTIPSSGFNYLVYGKLFQEGYSKECDQALEFNNDTSTPDTLGLGGILAAFIVIAGVILFYSNEKPKWYPIAAGIGFLLVYMIGWVAVGWIATSSLLAFLVILLIIGRYNKKPG